MNVVAHKATSMVRLALNMEVLKMFLQKLTAGCDRSFQLSIRLASHFLGIGFLYSNTKKNICAVLQTLQF